MAVPADIRAVPRPKNTIVDDSGRDGPKRYAVRERASTKYVSGGNPQPRNGKVVGHIINYEYVPVDTEIKSAPAVPDMLSSRMQERLQRKKQHILPMPSGRTPSRLSSMRRRKISSV